MPTVTTLYILEPTLYISVTTFILLMFVYQELVSKEAFLVLIWGRLAGRDGVRMLAISKLMLTQPQVGLELGLSLR